MRVIFVVGAPRSGTTCYRLPSRAMRGIIECLGLAFEAAQLDGNTAENDKRVNRKAFEKLAQPINAGSVDKSRRTLTDAEIARSEKLTASFVSVIASGDTWNGCLMEMRES